MGSPRVSVLRTLPYTTAESDEGPQLEFRPGTAWLRYDAPDGDSIAWTTVTFVGAAGLRVTPEVSCTTWMLGAYSRVGEVERSQWLATMHATAARRQTLYLPALRHFLVFFDHHCCVEVAARDVIVDVAAPSSPSGGPDTARDSQLAGQVE